VGRQGESRHRVRFAQSQGSWGAMENYVNTMIDDLLWPTTAVPDASARGAVETSVNTTIDDLRWPTTAVTHAIAAVARGDLLQTVELEVGGRPLKGEFLRAANIVNTMIKQLSVFTSEVTRVAREVGTDGKLGGQAQVRG